MCRGLHRQGGSKSEGCLGLDLYAVLTKIEGREERQVEDGEDAECLKTRAGGGDSQETGGVWPSPKVKGKNVVDGWPVWLWVTG